MRKVLVLIALTMLAAGCASPGAPGQHPGRTFGQAVGQAMVSPAVVVIGLLEGISSLPYLLRADLHSVDRAMKSANARVSLGRTYRYAYNRRIETVPKSGNTGKVFQHVSQATRQFHVVLKGYGVKDYHRYIITAVRSADRKGYTLYALVYRPARFVRVRDAYGRVRTIGPEDTRAYYKPFDRDANGELVDSVIDWAGVPRTAIATQKGQAILLTLAANSVLVNRRSKEFWAIRKRWIAGEYKSIAAERQRKLQRRLAKRG